MTRVNEGKVANSFLTVEKDSESTEGGETLVTFTVTSTSELPLAVRIVDPLPDSLSLADVGFHREHRFDHWTECDDDHVAYSETLLPEESVDAFYYLDADRDETQRLPEPVIEETKPIESDTAAAGGPPKWRDCPAGIDTARTVTDGPVPSGFRNATAAPTVAGEAEGENGSDSDDAADGHGIDFPTIGAHVESTDASRTFAELQAEYEQVDYAEFRDDVDQIYPDEVEFKELLIGEADTELPPDDGRPATDDQAPDHEPRSGGDSAGTEPIAAEQPSATAVPSDEASVLEQLIRELDERDLSEDDRKLLREQMGLTPPHHTTVTVRHLQTKVADLTAYIDALETFLDDEGTAGEVIGNLEADVEDVQANLDSLTAAVNDIENGRGGLSSRLETVEDELEDVSQVQDDVTKYRQEVGRLSEQLDGVQDAIESRDQRMDAELESLESTVSHQQNEITDLQRITESLGDKCKRIGNAFDSAARAFAGPFEKDSD